MPCHSVGHMGGSIASQIGAMPLSRVKTFFPNEYEREKKRRAKAKKKKKGRKK